MEQDMQTSSEADLNECRITKMEENEGKTYSPNPHCKSRSRAALSFMEVKSIVAASFGENERRCYKVHWKDSWIYEDHLFDCEEIIEQFWKEQECNMEDIQKSCTPNENGILRTSNKDDEKTVKNSELTVIVVSKDTENEMSITDEAVNGERNMTPDWLIARGIRNDNIKENDSWKSDDGDVKLRVTPKRQVLNIDGTTDDDSKENKLWESEDMELKCNMIPKKRHMLTCHICGDDFDMVSAIRRHYNTNHPGNKPFACDSCGKRFDRKENLNRHIRIHTGDRRYVCNHCGKGYTDPSGLKKHVLSKHSNLIFSCQFCKATFKSKDSMNRHLTKHLTELKAHKEGFDIGSKRPLFDNTIQGNKVVIHDGSGVNHMQSVTKDVAPGDLSENESSDASRLNETQKEYPDSESIEVSFIHLPHDSMSSQSTAEKINDDNGQFPNASTEHAHFVLPITTEQIIELASNAKALPITTEHFIPSISNTSSEQLIAVPVVSPQTFNYTGDDKLRNDMSANPDPNSIHVLNNEIAVESIPSTMHELNISKE